MASVFNVTISAGTISSSFDVEIINDVTHESNETIVVSMSLMSSALPLSVNVSSSTIRIIDNDGTYIDK